MTEWRFHNGISDPPLSGDAWVEIERSGGRRETGVVHDWDQAWQWNIGDDEGHVPDGAIVAYRKLDGEPK